MTITGRITSLASRTLRAAARVALALADRLEAPTAESTNVAASHGASGPEVGTYPPKVVDAPPNSASGPAPGGQGGAGGVEEASDASAPPIMRLVHPPEPLDAGAAAELDETENASPCGNHRDYPGGCPPQDASSFEPDEVRATVARTQEPEITRSMRLADETLTGRRIADVIAEVKTAMPLAEAVRIMREATGTPLPLSSTICLPSTAPDEPPPIIIDPRMPLTPVPGPVGRPPPPRRTPMLHRPYVMDCIIASVLYEDEGQLEQAAALRKSLMDMGVPQGLVARAVEAQRLRADLTTIIPSMLPRRQPPAS